MHGLTPSGCLLALAPFVVAGCAAEPASPVSRFAELDGRKVHYLDAGDGDRAIVLVHGWASDHRAWQLQSEALAGARRVLAVDLPGHGRSEEPAGDYAMDLFAEGIVAVLDDAGVDRAFLIGHSNGVPTVRQFYRRHPERTAGLILVDGALRAIFDEEMAQGFLARFGGDEFRDAVRAMVDGMPAFALTDERRDQIREMALAQPQHAVVGGLRASTDPAIWTDDPIDVPLLVLLAEQPAWTDEYEAFVRQLAPQVDYRVLPDVSHFIMLERPAEFNATVEAFLHKHGW